MTEKIKLGAATVLTTIALGGAPALAVPSNNGDDNPHNQITICHATGSQSNPYVQNSPNANGNVSGHDNHDGDIIPPFEYNDNGADKQYPGKNWDTDHQAIYNNGCKAGGQGGGNPETPGTVTQVSTTAGGSGGQVAANQTPQVATAPQGGVSAGAGGGQSTNAAAVAGLLGSIGAIVAGAARLVTSKKLF